MLTCEQRAMLTLQPKDVLTARLDRPRGAKRAVNADVRMMRGRSSATTTHVLTHARLIPLLYVNNNKVSRQNECK